jgi:hypothetical protein
MKSSTPGLGYSWKTFGQPIYPSETKKRLMKFSIKCKGVNNIPNISMFCKAERNELNHSNNLTSIKKGQTLDVNQSSSYSFFENNSLEIENMSDDSLLTRTHTVYQGDTEDLSDIEIDRFEKATYISEIDIYDKDFKRIAVAKMANPIKKREQDEYTFKIKVDV